MTKTLLQYELAYSAYTRCAFAVVVANVAAGAAKMALASNIIVRAYTGRRNKRHKLLSEHGRLLL